MDKIINKYFILFLLASNAIFCQITPGMNQSKGFVVLEAKTELSNSDKVKIEDSNFDEYRFYTIRQKIQIVRGPLIELLSIKELEQIGKIFSKTLVDVAKSRSETFKHEIILTLDLGVGISKLSKPE